MGNFKNIKLVNFRNFENYSLTFSNNCNVLFGKNGSGKTNILEGISLFSKGRGLRKDKISNILKKKLLINNDKDSKTLNRFYELVPFLTFLPDTERLFLSSPSSRRNFIDQLIYTHNYSYNKLVNSYTKYLQERSKILSNNFSDEYWLNELEKNISKYGLEIYSLRKKQVVILEENLNTYLDKFKLPFKIDITLSDQFFKNETNQITFEEELRNNRKIDMFIGGSKIGPHKSDYIFCVNDNFLASQLSTGQQKTIILLIYLSHCKYLINVKNKIPILLLDEVCSHLDEINRNILLTLVESFKLQVLMTGTTKDLFSFLSTNTNFCNITT